MEYVLTTKENDCRSCYKCIRNCPTKSISFKDGQARIIHSECVLCGHCYTICPQNCKVIRDDLEIAKEMIKSGERVICSIAPSFLAAYQGISFDTFKEALLKLGFSDVEETAIGATIVKKEYDRLVNEEKQDIIISTCCHSINLLIQKHYPSLAKYLAPVYSPMLMHAKDIKRRDINAKVIFIGPCISKKNEIEITPDLVDCVLTYLELDKWLKEEGIEIKKDPNPKKVEQSLARLFPTEGGVLDTMEKNNPNYQYLAVAGIPECMLAINDILNGNVHKVFIEMSSCEGSCINGPAMNVDTKTLIEGYISIHKNAGKKDFEVHDYKSSDVSKKLPGYVREKIIPTEEEIKDVLAKIGKTSKKDELNCSSCGYATCREKAIAVIEGKASLEMCLPFLMEKARSFSNSVFSESDNAIVVVNDDLIVQVANPAMTYLVGKKENEIVGKNVEDILKTGFFATRLGGIKVKNKRIYLKEYDKYCNVDITYDKQFHVLIGFFRDVTKAELERKKKIALMEKTAHITTEVINKNMRAVQEIASLLGESTAETKVALTNLKDVIERDDDSDE